MVNAGSPLALLTALVSWLRRSWIPVPHLVTLLTVVAVVPIVGTREAREILLYKALASVRRVVSAHGCLQL